jgi:hypothetical protein
VKTTLALEREVALRAKKCAGKLGISFNDPVNRALRIGLDAIEHKKSPPPFRTTPRPLGLRPGISLDHIADVLDKLDENQVQ